MPSPLPDTSIQDNSNGFVPDKRSLQILEEMPAIAGHDDELPDPLGLFGVAVGRRRAAGFSTPERSGSSRSHCVTSGAYCATMDGRPRGYGGYLLSDSRSGRDAARGSACTLSRVTGRRTSSKESVAPSRRPPQVTPPRSGGRCHVSAVVARAGGRVVAVEHQAHDLRRVDETQRLRQRASGGPIRREYDKHSVGTLRDEPAVRDGNKRWRVEHDVVVASARLVHQLLESRRLEKLVRRVGRLACL